MLATKAATRSIQPWEVLLGSLHDRSLGDLDSSTGATAVALDSENALMIRVDENST